VQTSTHDPEKLQIFLDKIMRNQNELGVALQLRRIPLYPRLTGRNSCPTCG
jgi:hypothetical protein